MFAYCSNCTYSTHSAETVGELMGTVKIDGGDLQGVYSKCPKCEGTNTIMVDLIGGETQSLADIINSGVAIIIDNRVKGDVTDE